MIYIDPSESRQGTRLHSSVISSAQELPGLETATGADILISLLNDPVLKDVTKLNPLTKAQLKKHIDSGLLTARKTGRDIINSIPRYDEILIRMRQWTPRPWLLNIGDVKEDSNGMCVIDGYKSSFTYAAYQGAMTWWQLRGGYISYLSRDSQTAEWISGWTSHRLKDLNENKSHEFHRMPQQIFDVTRRMGIDTLMTFDQIGFEKAKAIMDREGSLAYSLMWLSDLRNAEEGSPIPGIGKKTFEMGHQKLGLKEDECLLITSNDGEGAK